MTQAKFLNESTIEVVAKDGELFELTSYLPVNRGDQERLIRAIVQYFEECFSADKTSMVYWVLMKMMGNEGFSFALNKSERSEERKRIGSRIKQIRKEKNIEAKNLATLAKIDAANLSRIEQGRYAVGMDVLTRIADALGVKVDLV